MDIDLETVSILVADDATRPFTEHGKGYTKNFCYFLLTHSGLPELDAMSYRERKRLAETECETLYDDKEKDDLLVVGWMEKCLSKWTYGGSSDGPLSNCVCGHTISENCWLSRVDKDVAVYIIVGSTCVMRFFGKHSRLGNLCRSHKKLCEKPRWQPKDLVLFDYSREKGYIEDSEFLFFMERKKRKRSAFYMQDLCNTCLEIALRYKVAIVFTAASTEKIKCRYMEVVEELKMEVLEKITAPTALREVVEIKFQIATSKGTLDPRFAYLHHSLLDQFIADKKQFTDRQRYVLERFVFPAVNAVTEEEFDRHYAEKQSPYMKVINLLEVYVNDPANPVPLQKLKEKAGGFLQILNNV